MAVVHTYREGNKCADALANLASDLPVGMHAFEDLHIDGIREPVSGSLLYLYGNNILSGAIIPTSAAIGLHFIFSCSGSLACSLFSGTNSL